MAERRMFSKTIIDSDVFLDMPLSTQSLYFHLAMRADDDGFINNPKRIMRAIGSTDDEFKLLLAKRYLLSFDSGVVVIKHWRMHNYIQKDRYKETIYIEEKEAITIKGNKSYTELDTICIQDGYTGKVREGKVSIDKGIIVEPAKRKRFTPPAIDEIIPYCQEKGVDAQKWHDHYTANGWMVGRNKMKDWKAAVRTWSRNEFQNSTQSTHKEDHKPRYDGCASPVTQSGVCRGCNNQDNSLLNGLCAQCRLEGKK